VAWYRGIGINLLFDDDNPVFYLAREISGHQTSDAADMAARAACRRTKTAKRSACCGVAAAIKRGDIAAADGGMRRLFEEGGLRAYGERRCEAKCRTRIAASTANLQ